MAGSLNKVMLIGRAGRDPESRTFNNGNKVVNLRVATSERWRDKSSGDQREKTEWHQVVIYNEKIGEIAERYVKKGTLVYIEGQLATRKYTDSSGSEKYITEVVLQQFRGELRMLGESSGGGSVERESGRGEYEGSRSGGGGSSYSSDMDDDIPF